MDLLCVFFLSCVCYAFIRVCLGETGASSALGHVAIFSMLTKVLGLETYLEITCDEFVYMSTQWLHC